MIFLLDASSPLEDRILRGWIARSRPPASAEPDCFAIPSSRRRRHNRGIDPRLDDRLVGGDDPLLAPLRVAWLPAQRDGVRAVRFSDLLTFGDPRDPGALRQAWILRRRRDRCRIIAAEAASISELRDRWRRAAGTDITETTGLAEYVARQAGLALERAERRLRGARYKVPRFVREDILRRPSVRGGLGRLARELNQSDEKVFADASRALAEIAATHSPYVIDLAAHLIRRLYTQIYGEALHVDRERLEAVAALSQQHPVVFLPSHKSNLDHLVLQYLLYENGLPPNHTAGGINMNFFPIGPLVRRTGVFFIRRSFRDAAVYKFILRQYVDYLIEKRFTLEWYIEGGRSRSGKMLPPRFGLLAYVVDAFRRGKSEDVYLVPVSIAYDQIHEVGDYAAEQRGGAKPRESFRWFLNTLPWSGRRFGNIHIRFGEPLSLAKAVGTSGDEGEADADDPDLAIQKLAFEVAVRINRATPITPTSLVTLALLGTGERALTVIEILKAMGNLLRYVRLRGLPTTHELAQMETPDGVRLALAALMESRVVSCFDEGPEAVYAIGPDQYFAAAYYRNAICHFFVNGAIAELALVRASASDRGDSIAAFWDEAMRLRDLLKFEFFFTDKDAFRQELRDELSFHDSDWEQRLAAGAVAIQTLLRHIRPFSAHRVLRPFLEAYSVVADGLARLDPTEAFDEATFLEQALKRGKQYRLQGRLRSPESVSKVLFGTTIRLARNRDLIESTAADLAERRSEFASEIAAAVRRVDVIDALAAARRSGFAG